MQAKVFSTQRPSHCSVSLKVSYQVLQLNHLGMPSHMISDPERTFVSSALAARGLSHPHRVMQWFLGFKPRAMFCHVKSFSSFFVILCPCKSSASHGCSYSPCRQQQLSDTQVALLWTSCACSIHTGIPQHGCVSSCYSFPRSHQASGQHLRCRAPHAACPAWGASGASPSMDDAPGRPVHEGGWGSVQL